MRESPDVGSACPAQSLPVGVVGSGNVLGVGSVQRQHHLDAEVSTVSEEHGELGHGGHSASDLPWLVSRIG